MFMSVKGIRAQPEDFRTSLPARFRERRAAIIATIVLLLIVVLVALVLRPRDDLPTLVLNGADQIVAVRFHGKLDKSTAEIRKWIGDSRCPIEYQ